MGMRWIDCQATNISASKNIVQNVTQCLGAKVRLIHFFKNWHIAETSFLI